MRGKGQANFDARDIALRSLALIHSLTRSVAKGCGALDNCMAAGLHPELLFNFVVPLLRWARVAVIRETKLRVEAGAKLAEQ